MSESEGSVDVADLREDAGVDVDRKWAVLAVLPFLAIGLGDLLLLLFWGLNPLWGFMILPPILFVCVLAWITFRTGFAT